MKTNTMKTNALAVILLAALTLTGCKTPTEVDR